MSGLQAIRYSRGKLEVLDQLRLPHEHHYDEVSTSEEAFDCIKSMRVRGASPAALSLTPMALTEVRRSARDRHRRRAGARRGTAQRELQYVFLPPPFIFRKGVARASD